MNHHMHVTIFDIDGTIANDSIYDVFGEDYYYDHDFVLSLDPIPATIELARKYVRREDVQVIFLTAREHSIRDVTMQWVERHVGFTRDAKNPPLFFTKPPGQDHGEYKADTARRAVRSVCASPAIVEAYENDEEILKIYNAVLKPLCRQLRLFHVVDNEEVVKWEL